jgi:hypothetical protein
VTVRALRLLGDPVLRTPCDRVLDREDFTVWAMGGL